MLKVALLEERALLRQAFFNSLNNSMTIHCETCGTVVTLHIKLTFPEII